MNYYKERIFNPVAEKKKLLRSVIKSTILGIKKLTKTVKVENKQIILQRIPAYVGILGNKYTNGLAKNKEKCHN